MYPDANNHAFSVVEIFGNPVLFTTERINRTTVPEGIFAYDLQHSRQDWSRPGRISNFILTDHFGTVITNFPIKLGKNKSLDLGINDFSLYSNGRGNTTLAQFMMRHPPLKHPLRPPKKKKALYYMAR